MSQKVWFITGCSTGFGRQIAEYGLSQGDHVVVTARKLEVIQDFKNKYGDACLCLAVDVQDEKTIQAAVQQTLQTFGRIDVLVNNAGYGILAAFEDTPSQAILDLFATNVFGAMNVTRAILPAMRTQRSGLIINMSSIAGLSGTAGFSLYNASKFALEGFSEALALETKPLGINVLLVEPGPFKTDFSGRSLQEFQGISDYDPILSHFRKFLKEMHGKQPGDPKRAAQVLFDFSRAQTLPKRIVMGRYAFIKWQNKLKDSQKELVEYETVSVGTDTPGES